MPTPVYIIAVDNQIEDKRSNRVSLINVVEKVVVGFDVQRLAKEFPEEQLEEAKRAELAQLEFEMSILSVWLFEESDYGLYENEIAFQQDGIDLSPPIISTPFRVVDNAPTFHRVRVVIGGLPPLRHSGVWNVVNRIRREGEPWTSQSCPLLVSGSDEFFELIQTSKLEQSAIPRK